MSSVQPSPPGSVTLRVIAWCPTLSPSVVKVTLPSASAMAPFTRPSRSLSRVTLSSGGSLSASCTLASKLTVTPGAVLLPSSGAVARIPQLQGDEAHLHAVLPVRRPTR